LRGIGPTGQDRGAEKKLLPLNGHMNVRLRETGRELF
jgi:hypothetical protein